MGKSPRRGGWRYNPGLAETTHSLYPQDLHSSWETCWTCHGQAEGEAERGESLLQFPFTFLEGECLSVQHVSKVMAVEQQWGLAEGGEWL